MERVAGVMTNKDKEGQQKRSIGNVKQSLKSNEVSI